MIKKTCYLCLALLIWASAKPAQAVELFTTDAYPYMTHDPKNKGFLNELIIVSARQINVLVSPVFLPWKRAQATVKSGQNKLIVAVRSPKREDKYKWIAPLFNMQTVIATMDQKINSIEDARQSLDNLTVMEGIALQDYVLKKGYPQSRLRTLPLNKRLATFLEKSPKSGWIAQKMQIKSFWSIYAKNNPLIFGNVITERLLWLACSRKCNDIPTDKLKTAILRNKSADWYNIRRQHYGESTGAPISPDS